MARKSATAGIEVLDDLVETSPAKTLELVRTLLVLGEIWTKRERFTAARRAFARADSLLSHLEPRLRSQIQKALEDDNAALDAAQQDKEEPGE